MPTKRGRGAGSRAGGPAEVGAAAAEVGIKAGPEYHGLLKQIHVAETEEKALENARQFMWMQGEFTGLAHPVWSTPAGYGSPENRRGFAEFATGRGKNLRYRPNLEQQLKDRTVRTGEEELFKARAKEDGEVVIDANGVRVR